MHCSPRKSNQGFARMILSDSRAPKIRKILTKSVEETVALRRDVILRSPRTPLRLHVAQSPSLRLCDRGAVHRYQGPPSSRTCFRGRHPTSRQD